MQRCNEQGLKCSDCQQNWSSFEGKYHLQIWQLGTADVCITQVDPTKEPETPMQLHLKLLLGPDSHTSNQMNELRPNVHEVTPENSSNSHKLPSKNIGSI